MEKEPTNQKDVFVKAEEVKLLIRNKIGNTLTHMEIQRGLASVWHNKYHGTSMNQLALTINPLLERLNICSKSAYNWLRATQLPMHLQDKLKNRKLSMSKAFTINSNVNKKQRASIGLQILEEGRSLIRRL